MKYKLIIFDMDGTILDTLEDLKDALNFILFKYDMMERTLSEVRSFVGNGIKVLIEKAAKEGTKEEVIQKMFEDMMQYYQANCEIKTKPYDGIISLLKKLKAEGYLLAVVSNKADEPVQQLCNKYFYGLFDFAIGEKEGNQKKPAPDAVYEVLEKLNISKDDAIYVGDSEVDIQTAKNAGLNCIAVKWGFREEAFLREYGATCFVDKAEEVLLYV